jgi:hypothetical protein
MIAYLPRLCIEQSEGHRGNGDLGWLRKGRIEWRGRPAGTGIAGSFGWRGLARGRSARIALENTSAGERGLAGEGRRPAGIAEARAGLRTGRVEKGGAGRGSENGSGAAELPRRMFAKRSQALGNGLESESYRGSGPVRSSTRPRNPASGCWHLSPCRRRRGRRRRSWCWRRSGGRNRSR